MKHMVVRRMKYVASAVCCISLSTVVLSAQMKPMAGGSMTDQQFVDFVAQTDMVEANLGQLAQTASTNQSVKDFGQMLVTDHTKNYAQLGTIAKGASLNMPGSIDKDHDKMMIDPFMKLKGNAFDHKFEQEMVAGHTKAIAVFTKEAKDAQNPDLKSFAEQTLPALQKHLDAAKGLGKPSAMSAMTAK
jgi:putative membrane protein